MPPHVIPGHDPESVEHTAMTFTDPETIFVASACEYGVAVLGDVSMATGNRQNAPSSFRTRSGICRTYSHAFCYSP